jgi:hypothetical protein
MCSLLLSYIVLLDSRNLHQWKKEVEKKMVRISVEVKGGTATYRVAVQAQSIERALHIVQSENPTRECTVRFPIDPESFFAKEEERVGALGMAEAA